MSSSQGMEVADVESGSDAPGSSGPGNSILGVDPLLDGSEPAGVPSGALGRGTPLRDVLRVPSLAGVRILAGMAGLDRLVQRLNIMDGPDILPWVKSNELLLTTGYPVRNSTDGLARLVRELDTRQMAGLAIKLGLYVTHLPDEMLDEADRLGFPILELPAGVSFDDVLNQVLTGILNREASLLARAEDAHKALVQIVLGGGGMQELATEIAHKLRAGVKVTLTNVGRAVPAAVATAGSNGADGGEKRSIVDIIAAGVVHGRIEARRASPDFDEGDRYVLEEAATVAALVVTRELAVTAVERKYRGDFLRHVLDGRAGSAPQVVSRAAAFGWNFSRALAVAVVQFEAAPSMDEREERAVQERLTSTWERAVLSQDPSAATAGFLHEAVAVFGPVDGRSAAAVARAAHASLRDSLAGTRRPWAIGVSRVVHTVEHLPEAYRQAIRAVHAGSRVYGADSLTHFDSLGAFRILSLVQDASELEAFARETLGDLAGGVPEQVELRKTLEMLLETGLNVAEAARRMFCHYNTIRYRVEKIERQLGPFQDDARLRFDISLALRILEMKNMP